MLKNEATEKAIHVLACLSSSPSNKNILLTAARSASAFGGRFTALFVRTSRARGMLEADRERLAENMRLAGSLGAAVETVNGEDIVFEIAEFARITHVTDLFIGVNGRFYVSPGRNITRRLVKALPDVSVHVIPYAQENHDYRYSDDGRRSFRLDLPDVLKTFAVMTAATLINIAIFPSKLSNVNIITIYLISVLITSVITAEIFYGIIAAVISVILFNFLFIEPRFTFLVYSPEYIVTYLMTFLAAIITGTLAARLKDSARQSQETARKTRILLETNELLQQAACEDDSIRITAEQLKRLMDCSVLYYPAAAGRLGKMAVFPSEGTSPESLASLESERNAAQWTYENNQASGVTTEYFSDSACLYLTVKIGQKIYGVYGLAVTGRKPTYVQKNVLFSILGECALSIENERNIEKREKAEIIAQNERFRANLLRSISHDLRTPLTSIYGNASNLLLGDAQMDEATKKQLYSDIYDDATWLIDLVENLLSVTKLEDGSSSCLHKSAELINDIVTEAMKHIDRHSSEHIIQTDLADDFIFVDADARMLMQVVINLVNNAVKHTQNGSTIRVSTKADGDRLLLTVEDNGPGVSDDEKKHVFEMFYTSDEFSNDRRRGIGLGLALCSSIISAHGGRITLEDADPHGCRFICSLKRKEVELHE